MEREENTNLTAFTPIKGSKVLKNSPVKNRFVPGKAYLNFWIDLMAFLSFFICTVSGAALMRIEHGAFHSSGYTRAGLLNDELFWGLQGYEWAHLHNLTGLILVALIIVHIAMHWRRTLRAGYAVVFLNFLICTVSGAALMLISNSKYGTVTGSLNGELFWGLPGYEWAHLHNLIGWIFVVFAVIHIVRYHRWIARMSIRALHPGRTYGRK
ncbi:hypothetical protein MSBR3_0073 [Methanosarcina barkeri 3]|uniref:Flavinylation-associated cytochrome domain-containing protein n=1 Tax=Methanosarcina barkeri 3 TaxID=1434107 RepID=A0A0E3SHC2_METBA|nr:DUF4405 domain-containing protein [Methanosarcina barkeri]AKB80651.1 hypothetical protein MSBR3_0073 [Methanosarcina barkeri 3]